MTLEARLEEKIMRSGVGEVLICICFVGEFTFLRGGVCEYLITRSGF